MKTTFLEFFLICTLKDKKLAEKFTNLAENPKKKFNSAEFMEFVFPSLPCCKKWAFQIDIKILRI